MLDFDIQVTQGQPGMSETLSQKENFPKTPTLPSSTQIPTKHERNIFGLGMIY